MDSGYRKPENKQEKIGPENKNEVVENDDSESSDETDPGYLVEKYDPAKNQSSKSYSEDSDDDDKEREINQEMPKLLQQHNKVQMKPPHINELIDMLQLHAPKNSSEKSEISLQDFANIMYMADLL